MKITLRHIGSVRGSASKIIEMTVESYSTYISKDITNLDGTVDQQLIDNLREVADTLTEQNELIKEL